MSEAERRQVCAFRVGSFLFGTDVQRVHEVIRHQEITPVPLAPPEVCGLMNMRGQIVTVIDLSRRFDLPRRERVRPPVNLILRSAGTPVSILVDDVVDVMWIDPAGLEPPPETLSGIGAELIEAAYQLPEELLLMIDVDRAVALGVCSGAGS